MKESTCSLQAEESLGSLSLRQELLLNEGLKPILEEREVGGSIRRKDYSLIGILFRQDPEDITR